MRTFTFKYRVDHYIRYIVFLFLLGYMFHHVFQHAKARFARKLSTMIEEERTDKIKTLLEFNGDACCWRHIEEEMSTGYVW